MIAPFETELADTVELAIASGFRQVQLADGTYFATRPVKLPSDFSLRGAGPGATVIRSSVQGALFLLADDQRQITRVLLNGIAIEGGDSVILMQDAGSITISEIFIAGVRDGISIRKSTNVSIEDVVMRDFGSAGGTAILIDGHNEHFISDISIEGLGKPAFGIRIVNSQGTYIEVTSVIRTGVGISIEPAADDSVLFQRFLGVQVDSCIEDGIRIAPRGRGQVSDVRFLQCWSSTNGGAGVSVGGWDDSSVDGIIVADASLLNNGSHGVALSDENGARIANVQIAAGMIGGNGRLAPGLCDGVSVSSENGRISKVRIDGGNIGDASGFTGKQRYGVNVQGELNELIIDGTPNLAGNMRGTLNDGATTQFKRIGPIMGITNTWLPVRASRVISPNLNADDGNGSPHDRIRITGSGAIQRIEHGWAGRTLKMEVPAGVAFVTGGNIATPLPASNAVRLVEAEYNGAFWLLR